MPTRQPRRVNWLNVTILLLLVVFWFMVGHTVVGLLRHA